MKKLYIKNMVCRRCITAVEGVLQSLQFSTASIRLGEVILADKPTKDQLAKLSNHLKELGFELLDDHKHQIIDKIKTIIINQVHYDHDRKVKNLSEILTEQIQKDYSYLSNLFSEVEGITIEKYLINQRVERVKEMLIYNQLSLSEIAYQNGYSSVAHLSSQFKKVTGITPKSFKTNGAAQRKFIDSV
ncbi:MAG TPA: AraC family transcriptional regulator [Pedobacter sp.]